MQIFVKTLTGEAFRLDIGSAFCRSGVVLEHKCAPPLDGRDARGTIANIKARIADKVGIPPFQLHLVFAGKWVKDDGCVHKKLICADYKIKHGSILYVVHRIAKSPEASIILVVKQCEVSEEESIVLHVHASDTICVVKTKIAEKIGIPRHRQRLIFAGTELKHDDRTLFDYNIPQDSMVWFHLIGVGEVGRLSSFGFGGTNAHLVLSHSSHTDSASPLDELRDWGICDDDIMSCSLCEKIDADDDIMRF
jgi:hypothetical protein